MIALQSLVPALAVVLAFIFLGEPIRPAQVVGGAIIIGGVALDADGRRAGRVAPGGHDVTRRDRASAPPVPPLADGSPPLAILVDYDGTIALTDVSDTVMAERHVDRATGRRRSPPTTPACSARDD